MVEGLGALVSLARAAADYRGSAAGKSRPAIADARGETVKARWLEWRLEPGSLISLVRSSRALINPLIFKRT